MNIDEILKRKSPAYYTVDEMSFAVEKYIEKKKGIKVHVNIFKNFKKLDNLNPFGLITLKQEHNKLFNAFETVQLNYYK